MQWMVIATLVIALTRNGVAPRRLWRGLLATAIGLAMQFVGEKLWTGRTGTLGALLVLFGMQAWFFGTVYCIVRISNERAQPAAR